MEGNRPVDIISHHAGDLVIKTGNLIHDQSREAKDRLDWCPFSQLMGFRCVDRLGAAADHADDTLFGEHVEKSAQIAHTCQGSWLDVDGANLTVFLHVFDEGDGDVVMRTAARSSSETLPISRCYYN